MVDEDEHDEPPKPDEAGPGKLSTSPNGSANAARSAWNWTGCVIALELLEGIN